MNKKTIYEKLFIQNNRRIAFTKKRIKELNNIIYKVNNKFERLNLLLKAMESNKEWNIVTEVKKIINIYKNNDRISNKDIFDAFLEHIINFLSQLKIKIVTLINKEMKNNNTTIQCNNNIKKILELIEFIKDNHNIDKNNKNYLNNKNTMYDPFKSFN